MFKEVKSKVDFPRLEHRILKFWKDTGAFEKRVALNRGKKRWSFIDGPITANNPMGVHHAWGRAYKDVFQRYRAMNGFELRYQNGFDCQGLWIEVEVERNLGFKSKRDIERYGVAEFVKRCKERALRYAAKQVEQSIRLGYWMNWDDPELLRELADRLESREEIMTVQGSTGPVSDTVESLISRLGSPQLGGSYFTFSDENNYTIWAVLKRCHERGWIYKGRDVMPWCPRCSTALSQHEIVTEGYREITHVGVTLRFPLRGRPNEALLVWTTTPWTLSSNVAAAVHPDMFYAKVRYNDEILYLAKAALGRVFANENYELIEELMGVDMLDWTYIGPFDEFMAEQKHGAVDAHRIIPWEEVSEVEGTGIVHIAPGCGKEDLELGKQHDLPTVAPLSEFGFFVDGFDWLTGTHVYESAQPIISNLKEKDLLFKVEDYTHRYPVCWRCDSELVFRLVNEWFIFMGRKLDKPLEQITEQEKTENLRYQIMEVAEQVRWIPDFGLYQELDWLRNMDDWMISKKRYWGLALPIWECPKCGNFDVIGGDEELKSRAVEGWKDFEGHSPHRPWIDMVKIKCSTCGAVASRISDVGNPWLDAGIVAYSTLNYRHNRYYWAKWFPADLICESLPGQFRNWFYSMLAMSTILERCPPFRTCFGHGQVQDEKGQEMHKSSGNMIEFDDASETMGADVMRWIYCRSKPEKNILFGYTLAEDVERRFLMPLWNVYNFFVTYANLDKWTPKNATTQYSVLDCWILSKLQVLVQDVTGCLEKYDSCGATASLEQFVDELSKWYVRRSRRRFWKSEADLDKKAGYTTLHTCLTTTVKLLAPFLPFLAEEMYQNLVCSVNPNAPQSVHHNDWPQADTSLIDEKLMADMDLTIKICSLGRSARNKAGIKLRQPLKEAKVVAEKPMLERLQVFTDLIRDELNVKELFLTTQERELVGYEILLLPHLLGKKYGKLFPKLCATVADMDADALNQTLQKGHSIKVEVDDHVITLLPKEIEVRTQPKEGYILEKEQDIIVGVYAVVTEELKKEGLAREIVRRVQNQRKDAGFDIADQIEVYYEAGPRLTEVFSTHGNYIASETLSTSIRKAEPAEEAHVANYKINGESLRIGLTRTNHT
ncbi:MAG: class I tRNA ligase family protein [Candidatus Bathyarchaeota archaeon]|nr:class I tRNA ligase family protein [Candidatus Bathyarchaeota archaeon]MDH5746898.1 class I tRNA ligase family protein [Candidatus Bathyarchaeota archaeon]